MIVLSIATQWYLTPKKIEFAVENNSEAQPSANISISMDDREIFFEWKNITHSISSLGNHSLLYISTTTGNHNIKAIEIDSGIIQTIQIYSNKDYCIGVDFHSFNATNKNIYVIALDYYPCVFQ